MDTNASNASEFSRVLTPGERKTMEALLTGLTDTEAAKALGVGPRCVQRRVYRVMNKLGANTRIEVGVMFMKSKNGH